MITLVNKRIIQILILIISIHWLEKWWVTASQKLTVSGLWLGHLWLWFNILYILIVCLAICMYFYLWNTYLCILTYAYVLTCTHIQIKCLYCWEECLWQFNIHIVKTVSWLSRVSRVRSCEKCISSTELVLIFKKAKFCLRLMRFQAFPNPFFLTI